MRCVTPSPKCRSDGPSDDPILPRRPVICQVLHTLRVGGAEVLAARLGRRLSASYRFVYACLDELGELGAELRQDGFSVTVLGRDRGVDWSCSRRLAHLCRRERVDLIHAHQYTPFFYAITARLLYRRPPVLFTEHGRHFPDYPKRKRMVVNRLLLEKRDRVVGVGQSVRRALMLNEGIPARSVDVIYNGINLKPFLEPGPARYQVRRQLGVDPNDIVLILVARLDPLKDHVTAVRALARVHRMYPNVRLLLVGEGPQHGVIEKEVRRWSLEQSVRFLGLRDDVHRLLAACDICLLTSVSEGIPLTLIEAMASSLPVVATRVGGVPEVVEDGRTGILVDHGDTEALAKQIVRLIENPALRLEMGRLGRQRAIASFSENQMHSEYHDLYAEMLRIRTHPGGQTHAAGVLG